MCDNEMIQLYIHSLSDKNRTAFEIAQRCLGITFNVQKSIGFIKWKTEYISQTTETNDISPILVSKPKI
jgi:hypothetical protein